MRSLTDKNEIIASLPAELAEMAVEVGLPKYRGDQLFNWIHKRSVLDFDLMKNLPISFRRALAEAGDLNPVRCGTVLSSKDGTRKIEVLLKGGGAVETVLIPDGDKLTQCISSQLGCAVGCVFCRSGAKGLKRNLSAGEIIGQIFLARDHLRSGEKLRNVVLMGVGEPLHNLGNVLQALKLLSHPDGMGLSSRRVTLSSVGIPAGIDRLGAATRGKSALAISLHASSDEVRRQLVPNVGASLDEIIEALLRYPLPERRRFTIEYVLVKGINDSDADARRLVKLLAKLKVKINLLPLNPHDKTDLLPPSDARIFAFQKILLSKGVSAFLRKRRGADINAACGQLLALEPSNP